MGEVYAAEDVNLGRRVAVKLLPSELCCGPAATERFTREAQIVSLLNHPNICRNADAEFLDCWRTADTDLPLVIEATRALSRLGS